MELANKGRPPALGRRWIQIIPFDFFETVAQPLWRISKHIIRTVHPDTALGKLTTSSVVSCVPGLSPPVGEFGNCVKGEHLELQTLELLLIAVTRFVGLVFAQQVGGMLRCLDQQGSEVLVLAAFVLMSSELGECGQIAQ